MADDGRPARIRWQPEPGLFAGFSGYVGTVEPALFRIYAPDAPDGEHALCSMLPGMGNKASYGDEAEVKARAEEWLGEFASSLGAVFPPPREHCTDWEGKPCSRTPAIPAGPWEVVDGG